MERVKGAKVTAGDLMKRPVQTVSGTDRLQVAVAMFNDGAISAAAVTDRNGKLAGVITKTDIARYEYQRMTRQAAVEKCNASDWSEPGLPTTCANDIVERWMTPVIFSVPASASAAALATRMLRYGTHHIFVRGAKPGSIVGIVSSFDLLRVVIDGA